MKRLYWGKWALMFSLAVLLGLVISLKLLQAHATVEEVVTIDRVAEQAVKDYDLNDAFNADLLDKLRVAEEERALLPVTGSLMKSLQHESDKKGEPLLRIVCGGLFAVNEKGEVLAWEDGRPHIDVPIMTGTDIKIDPKTNRLSGRSFSEAVRFIRSMKKKNRLLAHQLSEVHCHPTVGLVAYFSHTGTLPIFVGRGRVEEKSKKVTVLFEQMGGSELVSSARYVDARLNGQLVVKKNR